MLQNFSGGYFKEIGITFLTEFEIKCLLNFLGGGHKNFTLKFLCRRDGGWETPIIIITLHQVSVRVLVRLIRELINNQFKLYRTMPNAW